MKVEFISFSKKPEAFIEDPSFRYRCQNLSIALCNSGINSSVQHLNTYKPSADTTHVVFHRPKYSLLFKRIIKQLKRSGVIAIADFDDLVFDQKYLDFHPAILNKIQPRKKIAKIYKSHFVALNYFEHVSVSTENLARYVRNILPNANINVLHNTTHYEWPYRQENTLSNRPPIITYFPGTRSHDRDFWQIEDTVEFFLNENPSLNLLIVGPLTSALLNKQNPQIKHIQKLPFADYIQAASNSWVNLLPLEPTPFNQCKSAIKVIEAAAYNAPTICSPLPDALRFNGSAAFTAIDHDQWLEKLNDMMDPEFYQKTVNNIKENFSLATSPKTMVEQFNKSYCPLRANSVI